MGKLATALDRLVLADLRRKENGRGRPTPDIKVAAVPPFDSWEAVGRLASPSYQLPGPLIRASSKMLG